MPPARRRARRGLGDLLRLFCTLLLCQCGQALAAQDEHWLQYQQRYVEGGRVLDTGNGRISHSEGQGWGMLLAEAHGDRTAFDRLWTWTRQNLKREDMALFSWRYDPAATPPVQDPNNASDGDILIAWALLRAAERWDEPTYARASEEIREALLQHQVRYYAGYTVLLPGLHGFAHDDRVIVNFSYLVAPAIRAFAAADPAAGWQWLLIDGDRLLSRARFGTWQLPPDWLTLKADGAIEPAAEWKPRFSFDAVRIPLYLLWGGTPADSPLLEPFRRFWHCCEQPHAWVDLTTEEYAPYPASAGVRAIIALLEGDHAARPAPEEEDYYSASLRMLAALAGRDLDRQAAGE